MDKQIIINAFCEKLGEDCAFLDKDYKVVKSNIRGFGESIDKDSITYFARGVEVFENDNSNAKNGVVRFGDSLIPLGITPVVDYETDEIVGYDVKKISLSQVFGDKYVPDGTMKTIRTNTTNACAYHMMIENYLEENEIYEGIEYLNDADQSCLNICSATENSRLLKSLFEDEKRIIMTDVGIVVENILNNVKFDFAGKVKIEDDVDCFLWTMTEEEYLMAAIMNLIINSYIYALDDDKTIKVTLKEKNGYAYLTVEDNGMGIRSEASEDEYFDKVSLREGLGLSYVKMYVKLFGGDFKIISKGDGEGTIARLAIPLYKADKDCLSYYLNYRENVLSTYNSLVGKTKVKRRTK